jgi:hypothetical protein
VLVTTEAVADDPDFQRAQAQGRAVPMFVATVRRDGRCRLWERNRRGRRLIREARLDLDLLLPKPPGAQAPVVPPDWPHDLPAILAVKPFPLRLSQNIEPQRMVRVEGHGVLGVTRDRRLLLWARRGRGAHQIADDAPPGELRAAHRVGRDEVLAVVGCLDAGRLHLLRIDLRQFQWDQQRLEIDQDTRAVCFHREMLFAISRGRVQVIETQRAETVQRMGLPSTVVWHRDRFFRDNDSFRWYALSHDGRTAHLEPLMDQRHPGPRLAALLEREGADGPIGVTAAGHLFFTARGQLRKLRHGLNAPVVVQAISRDGRRLVLADTRQPAHLAPRSVVVDTTTLSDHSSRGDPALLAEWALRDYVRPVTLRHRFTHLQIRSDRTLVLVSRKQRCLAITYCEATHRIRLVPDEDSSSFAGPRKSFRPVDAPSGVGYRLSVVTWADGSRAYLDSRGLLHLKSADRSVPETTIVLYDDELSGWCSNGSSWGRPYFIGNGGSSTGHAFQTVIRPFAERLP